MTDLALRTENERLAAELKERVDFMRREGYRECRTPACNCNSWHGGRASDRLSEIGDVIDSTGTFNGVTIIDAVRSLIDRAPAAESALAAATRERDEARLAAGFWEASAHGEHKWRLEERAMLREKVARLREAIEPFSRLYPHHDEPDHWPAFGKKAGQDWPTVGDFRAAARVLAEAAPADGGGDA